MKKFLICAPLKLERLFIWTRNQGNRGTERWQLKENDEQTGILIVELVKGKNQSLGLTISGGTDKPKPPHVANVRSGGLADQSDYFCIGDSILEINEKDVTKLKHGELIKFIQEAGKRLCFKMQYKNLTNGETVGKVTTLKLFKEDNEIKFTLRGGRSKDGLVTRPVVVTDLNQKSEIAKCGELFEGDNVLAIDNRSIDNLHISEIKPLLKELRSEYTLKIQYEVKKLEVNETANGSIIVEIFRPHESVHPGLSLDVSLDHEQHGSIVIISELKESGLVSRTGTLSVGDLVLAINGISMDGMSVDQARKIMDSSGKTIQLEVLPSERPTEIQPLQRSMNDFLQLVVKEKPLEPDPRTKTPTLPLARPTLRQYPSKSSLTSLRRLNNQERTVVASSKPPDIPSPYPNYRSLSLKRSITPHTRLGSFDDSRSMMSACSTLSQCNVGNMVSKAEFMRLVLIAEDGDYGMEVQVGLNGYEMNCIVVRAVVSGKAADRSGVIQAGDRIVSINGIRTEFMSCDEFQRVLYDSGTSLRMEIEFDVTDAIVPSSGTFTVKIPRSENTGIILAGTSEDDIEKYPRVVDIKKGSIAYRMGILVPGDQIVHINGSSTNGLSLYEANEMIRKCYDIMKITVKKDEEIQGNTFGVEFNRRGEQLGITISGSEEPFDPIYITSIVYGSIAGRSGAVLVGDRLLAINEITLRGKPLWKAFELLRTSGDTVKLLIKRSLAPTSAKSSQEKELAINSCEITPASRDIQQWVLNSTNLDNILEKEQCPTVTQDSASTESYCDISDAADTPSSLSGSQSSVRKRVTKRPTLPAWQRECLRKYDTSPKDGDKDLSSSGNFGKATEHGSPGGKIFGESMSLGLQADRANNDVRLRNSFRPITETTTNEPAFNWNHALASDRKELVMYNDEESIDSGNDPRESIAVARLYDEERDRELSRLLNESRELSRADTESDISLQLRAEGRSLSFYSENSNFTESIGESTRMEYERSFKADAEPDSRSDFEKRRFDRKFESLTLGKGRSASRIIDAPKPRYRAQSASGGLSRAVAFFENLENGKPSVKYSGRSSLKSFKSREKIERNERSSKELSSLTISPFQLDMSNKSERCLRDLERKTEAQYNEMMEKLGKTSFGSIETAKHESADDYSSVFKPIRVDKPSHADSGYSTTDPRSPTACPRSPGRGKFDRRIVDDDDLCSDDSPQVTTHRIVLTKRETDADFGFSVSERVDGRGIYVKSIQTSAGKSGKLKKYDRILQVNGISTRELSCDQVVPLLQAAGRRLQLVVERVKREST